MKRTISNTSKRHMTSAARREQILRAACSLFAMSGYDTVSIRAIALECNCSPSLIISFFKTKEAIYSALVEKFESYCSIPVINNLPDGTGLAALKSIYAQTRGHLTIGPASYGYHLKCAIESRPSCSDIVRKALSNFQNLESDVVLPLVQRGRNDNSLPLFNEKTLANILTCILFGTCYLEQRFPAKKQLTFEEVLHYVLQI